jgi:hypothetical protein
MASGGGNKTDYDVIIIEADEESVAASIFEEKLDITPYDTTCDCCGPDFSISRYETLDSAQQYDRDSSKKIIYTKE